jgi:hypothetical protein
MKRRVMLFVVLCAVTGAGSLFADATSVGLGLSAGVALPQGNTASIASTDWQPSFNWGFYVNIPLISTFHITPSSELYKFNTQNATDVDIAFKFIVPLGMFDIYAGVATGLTAIQDILAPHVGVLGGAAFRLVGNLDAFTQVKYTVLFQGNQNINIIHVTAGVLFAF